MAAYTIKIAHNCLIYRAVALIYFIIIIVCRLIMAKNNREQRIDDTTDNQKSVTAIDWLNRTLGDTKNSFDFFEAAKNGNIDIVVPILNNYLREKDGPDNEAFGYKHNFIKMMGRAFTDNELKTMEEIARDQGCIPVAMCADEARSMRS